MARQQVRGIMIIPEKFKLLSTSLTHTATRYIVYADRAKTILLLDVILTGTKKDSYTYYDDTMYDDQILYFTTNMQLSDDSWTGESPLTRVVLRREQVSSSGIIVTPNVSIDKLGLSGGFTINASDYVRYEGTSSHDSTTYRIEDEITGEIAFEKIDDRNNLLAIKVPEDILKPNRVYRISVRFKDAVGRYSNYGSMLYNYSNLLYTMFPIETMTINYGSMITLENNAIDRVVYDLVSVEGMVDGVVVYNGVMLNNKIIIDSKSFSIGDILELKITMGLDVRYVNVFIGKTINTSIKYDSTFNLTGVFENITMDLNTIVDDYGTTKQEFKDGYIYDFTNDSKLVRYKYNDTTKKLTDYRVLIQYNIPILNTYRRVIENPIDGNIIVLAATDLLTNPHTIIVIDINSYSILKVIDINSANGSMVYSQQPLITDSTLYLINQYNTTTSDKTVYALNLLTYVLELKGSISFSSLEANTDGYIYASGYTQVLYKGEIYFINNGGLGLPSNTVGKTVYRLNRTTMILEPEGILNIDMGIPAGSLSSIIHTLKNGKVGLIFSKCDYSINSTPVRTIKGIYYIDLDTMTVDTTNMITGTAHTTTHTNNVLLNDGTFLFFNNTECVHFK